MTDTTAEAQHQIFAQPLDSAELQAVNALVAHHKGNAALTQQLALDASRLMTTSQDRLSKQANSGFFKRFANKISGKTSENQQLNQLDMLQMQKYAWHYLKQLQQQNLINAQSIAVIRNNLGTVTDAVIETREFLEQAIDKIDSRLKHVENNTRFNNWSLHIEANKRRFKSFPGNLLVLHLTYDFLRSHSDVEFTSRDINYLVVTLEKLGVNCDEEVQLLGFIIELIEQIEITGIERYREMIALAFEEHQVDSHFIQKNISGIGFNALYFLSEQYEKIVDLTEDSEFCKTDQDREKIISKFFGNEFSGLATTYRIRDLIGEVVGGSLLAIEIYKDVNGLNVIEHQGDEDEHEQVLSLTSSLPDIHSHTYLDSAAGEEAKCNYLRLFALCIENSATLSKQGEEFLALLCERAGYPQLCAEIIALAHSPHKTHEYLPVLQTLLHNDDKVYTWLADAFFLLTLCQKKIENPQVARILATLKPNQFKESFPHLLSIIREGDEALILSAAAKLAPLTQGWKNVVRYRELRFEHTYSDAENNAKSSSIAASRLSTDLIMSTMKAMDYSHFMGSFDEDSFFGKLGSAVSSSAFVMGRSSSLSGLNEMRRKARSLISEHSSALARANSMISRLQGPTIDFKDNLSHSDYELDNGSNNDDWYDQFSHIEGQINDALTAFSSACSDAGDQLGYFRAGDFDKSVIEIRAQKHAAHQLQQQQEKLAKQSVILEKDGREHLFSIEWQEMDNPPCDPEQIQDIKTNGSVWLIVDNDGGLYRSENRNDWQKVLLKDSEDNPYVNKLQVVNDVWILRPSRGDGFYYSNDALTWKLSTFPEVPSSWEFSPTDDIVHFNGQWLWRFTERTEYSFTDKGFLFDSTKTASYQATVIYCTQKLNTQWQRWEGTPELPDGVSAEKICALPDTTCLLVFCKYDYMYASLKKKTDAASFVSYYIPGKSWRNCTWGSSKDGYSDAIVTRLNGNLMCFYSGQVLTSDKGYDWKLHHESAYVNECFHLEGVSLFLSRHTGQTIYLSNEGKTFKELILDEGQWKYVCANNQGILSVYAPDSHETFLRSGRVIYQAKA